MRWWIIGVLILAVVLIGGRSGDPTASRERTNCDDRLMALVMSERPVKAALKAPATASFPGVLDRGISVATAGRCEFFVVSYVDAQNSFGAKIRSSYSVKLRYDPVGDTWTSSQLSIK